MTHFEGILPLNKPPGKTSFAMVGILRKLTGIRTIGHAGTLDPFATGVLLLLIGKPFTKLSSQFLNQDKEYLAKLHLGVSTDSFDCDGQTLVLSPLIPTLAEIEKALLFFQGTIQQIPPMFSAKKIGGKKLYELARKGISIERQPVSITLTTQLISFNYPYLEIQVHCSKGTYIRSIADDLGNMLGCGAHLCALERIRSGAVRIEECCDATQLNDPAYHWQQFLRFNP